MTKSWALSGDLDIRLVVVACVLAAISAVLLAFELRQGARKRLVGRRGTLPS